MEGILCSEEISEMIPFGYSENIIYFPVRHHSPGCSYHLQKVMERYRPDCILVEGPQTADKLIPILTDSGTVPPVAFYYFYKDTAKYISEEAEDYKCYYPFLRTSPEYNALCYAKAHGIDCGFIDLPYGDILIHTAAEKGMRRKEEVSSYGDEHYLSESRYFAALCEKTGLRSFEEFWEKYFETDALSVSTEEYIRRMYTYCYITRRNTPQEEMLADGCLVRESFMAEQIRKAAQRHDKILVVTGGFHSYGLYQLIEGMTAPQPHKAHRFSEKVQDVYAMRYSFEAADALNGYASGMQHPGFYDRVWQGVQEHQPMDSVYETAVMDTLLQCAKACVKEKLLITMSDMASAVTMMQGLAALRDKKAPGLYELFDGVRSCFIKGEKNAAGDLPLRLLGEIATGNTVGQLCDSAEKVPIVQDFETLSKKYKLKVDSVMEQKIELSLFAKPQHAEISRLFYRLGFLDTGFARRLKGADLIHNSDRSRIREQWAYKHTADVDAALIDVSAYGGTIEEACTVLSRRRLKDTQKCSDAAKLYVECFLMGISVTDGFAGQMENIIIADGDFFSIGQGLYYFNMLHSLYELYQTDNRQADDFLRQCFYKAVTMLPKMIHVNEDRAEECIRICRLLYSLVSGALLKEEAAVLQEAFGSMIQQQNPEPSVYGAVLGLLYGSDNRYQNDIRMAVQAYLSGSREMQKQGASFLRGLFSTARDIVLIGEEFIQMTDRLLQSFSMEEFMEILPELRLAFSYFSPYEIDRISEKVAGLYGSSAEKMRQSLTIDKDIYTAGTVLEREILKEMGWNT